MNDSADVKKKREEINRLMNSALTAQAIVRGMTSEQAQAFVARLILDEKRIWMDLDKMAQRMRRKQAQEVFLREYVAALLKNQPDLESDEIINFLSQKFPHMEKNARREIILSAIWEFSRDVGQCHICEKPLSRGSADTHFLHEVDCGYDIDGCDCDIPVHEDCCPECNAP